MKAKEFLEKVKVIDSQIETTMAEIVTLEAIAQKTTSTLGGERVQTSFSNDKMADVVVKIIEAKEDLQRQVEEFVDYRKLAREVIRKACDADCHKLLYKRYIGFYDEDAGKVVFQTWEQIAVDMGFTYQWVSDGLHKRALAQVQKELDRRKVEEND